MKISIFMNFSGIELISFFNIFFRKFSQVLNKSAKEIRKSGYEIKSEETYSSILSSAPF